MIAAHPSPVRTPPLGGQPWRTPAAFADFVARLLDEELRGREAHGQDEAPIRSYYAAMLGPHGRPLPLATFAYVQRLWPLVEVLRASPGPLEVLDAGCGYGTEAYLMGLMGHHVTGVELVEERAAVARSRRDFFASRATGGLTITFETANVFQYLQQPRCFDLIWLMEAISHIHPPERFFAVAREALAPEGRLIISDPNRRNPVALWRSIRIRGSIRHRPHLRFRDPGTGQPVEYGQEHITSPRALSRALARAGFEVESVAMSGFMATTLLPPSVLAWPPAQALLAGAAGFARRLPVVRTLGSLFTLVATVRRTGG